MLFRNYTYSPHPAKPNIRLQCSINIPQEPQPKICEYQIHPHHRNKNPLKSQWSISYEEEIAVFAGVCCDGIIEKGQYMWGLYLPGNEPEVLGETKFHDKSRIATFDNGYNNGFWHGYPADYIRGQEVPSEEVLDLWKRKNYIKKSDISKILKGQW